MSAFVVEDKVINDVVNHLATSRRHGSFEYHRLLASEFMVDMANPKEVEGLAVAMFRLNVNAVDQRYGDGEAKEFRELNFRYLPQEKIGGVIFIGEPITAVQAYKSLQCWLYQCAEGDVPGTSLLYAAMEKVHAEMAHNIVQAMTAYDKAKW
jgi:hypothetical protein